MESNRKMFGKRAAAETVKAGDARSQKVVLSEGKVYRDPLGRRVLLITMTPMRVAYRGLGEDSPNTVVECSRTLFESKYTRESAR